MWKSLSFTEGEIKLVEKARKKHSANDIKRLSCSALLWTWNTEQNVQFSENKYREMDKDDEYPNPRKFFVECGSPRCAVIICDRLF